MDFGLTFSEGISFFAQNKISGFFIIGFFLSFYFCIVGLSGKFPFLKITIPSRAKKKKSKITKFGILGLVLSTIGFCYFLNSPTEGQTDYSFGRINSNPLLGNWEILPDSFNDNQKDFIINFEKKGKYLRGTVLTNDRRDYGFLRSIKVDQSNSSKISGKIGMQDGRKLSFEGKINENQNYLTIQYSRRKDGKYLGEFTSIKLD